MQTLVYIYIQKRDQIRQQKSYARLLRFYVRRYPIYFFGKYKSASRAKLRGIEESRKSSKKQERVMYDLSSLYVHNDVASSSSSLPPQHPPPLPPLSFTGVQRPLLPRSPLFLAQQPLPQLLLPTFEVTSRPFRPSVTSPRRIEVGRAPSRSEKERQEERESCRAGGGGRGHIQKFLPPSYVKLSRRIKRDDECREKPSKFHDYN